MLFTNKKKKKRLALSKVHLVAPRSTTKEIPNLPRVLMTPKRMLQRGIGCSAKTGTGTRSTYLNHLTTLPVSSPIWVELTDFRGESLLHKQPRKGTVIIKTNNLLPNYLDARATFMKRMKSWNRKWKMRAWPRTRNLKPQYTATAIEEGRSTMVCILIRSFFCLKCQ